MTNAYHFMSFFSQTVEDPRASSAALYTAQFVVLYLSRGGCLHSQPESPPCQSGFVQQNLK